MSQYRQPSVSPAASRASTMCRTEISWFVLLAGQQVEQDAGAGGLGGGEEGDPGRRVQPRGDQVGGHLVPVPGLAEHVQAREPAAGTGLLPLVGAGVPGHVSRRRIAASSPIPPTIVTSRGASSGGPISML